jgi:DNA-binding NtrC family response regulator
MTPTAAPTAVVPLFDTSSTATTDTISQASSDNIRAMEGHSLTPRILLVDDDPASVFALYETLRNGLRTARLDSATYAPTAIRMLSATSYDVIITDVVMPNMDGLAVLQAARWLRPTVPVILVTGQAQDREEAALYGGAYAFLEKPVDPDAFLATVRAALAQPDLVRRVRERNQASFLNLIDSLGDLDEQLR